jgi:5-formaminoimidazole-4-carboxamide-1-beta-D-ribofuranosyl 5'-monophosphate synthetase
MSEFVLSNEVVVSLSGHPHVKKAPIVFDLKPRNTNNPMVGMSSGKIYQNITVEDAKRIRKELKAAIKNASGK